MLGRLSRPHAAGLVLALSVGLAGCTSDGPDGPDGSADPAADSTSAGSDPGVLQPGSPGDGNRTLSPDEVTKAAAPEFDEADVAFMQMMVPHHAQAIEMAKLAPSQAASRKVRVLAGRIRAAQGPEILMMASWLQERNMQVPSAAEDPSEWDHSTHGHNPMVGMLTEAQMRRLADARGAEFDRLFLRGMIQHHRGAIEMAEDVAVDGTDIIVSEVAADVAATQSAEIDRMRHLLASLA